MMLMNKFCRNRNLIIGISILIAMASSCPAAESAPDVQWTAVFLNGRKCGYVKQARSVKNGVVEDHATFFLEIDRAGLALRLETRIQTRETVQGDPISFFMNQKGFGTHTETQGTLLSDGRMLIKTRLSSGETSETFMDWPENAVINEGARLMALKQGLAPGTQYDFIRFLPDMVKFAKVTAEVGQTGFEDLLGRVVKLTRVRHRMNISGTMLQSESWVDDRFFVQKAITELMGLKFEMTACTEKYALSPNDPSDFLDSMLIGLDSSPDGLDCKTGGESVRYVVTPKQPAAVFNLPVTIEQNVTPLKDGAVEIVVDHSVSPPAGIPIRYSGTDPNALKHLEPTRWLQHRHEKLQGLARKAAGNAKHAREAAVRMEKFVHDYILKKNLSIGYATALEAAESREGDCTEHALLLAAMFRASGLPSRVASGLAYAKTFMGRRHVMVPHAWTQALIEDRWYSFDAALNGFDAGHIALAHGDGDPVHFFGMANLIGNVRFLSAENR